MDFSTLMTTYRNTIQSDFSYSHGNKTYRISSTGITEGSIQGNYATHSRGEIKLYLPTNINDKTTIAFLLTLLEDQYTVNSFSKTLEGVIAGRLSLDNPSHFETLSVLIDKRTAFIQVSERDIDNCLPFFDAFFTRYYYLREKAGLLVFLDSENIADDLNNIIASIETELLIDIHCVYGDKIQDLQKLRNVAVELKNGIELSKRFNIRKKIIPLTKLLPYQVITSSSPTLRKHLIERVFNDDFQSALDEELIATIDTLFEHDLNLTDTAKHLFIHRNTLLYRIEKIVKLTGFDLKKFSDSFIFNVAWIIKKSDQ